MSALLKFGSELFLRDNYVSSEAITTRSWPLST